MLLKAKARRKLSIEQTIQIKPVHIELRRGRCSGSAGNKQKRPSASQSRCTSAPTRCGSCQAATTARRSIVGGPEGGGLGG